MTLSADNLAKEPEENGSMDFTGSVSAVVTSPDSMAAAHKKAPEWLALGAAARRSSFSNKDHHRDRQS
jgi:hypothetical protein